MPESVYDVILLIGSSNESWEKAAANAVEQASNLCAIFASRKSPNSICNWTRRERWKPIARRSGYRSKSSAEDQINACS
jgi:Dodecin